VAAAGSVKQRFFDIMGGMMVVVVEGVGTGIREEVAAAAAAAEKLVFSVDGNACAGVFGDDDDADDDELSECPAKPDMRSHVARGIVRNSACTKSTSWAVVAVALVVFRGGRDTPVQVVMMSVSAQGPVRAHNASNVATSFHCS